MSAMDDLRRAATHHGRAVYPEVIGKRVIRVPQIAATAPADPDAGADTADTAQAVSAGGETHGTDSLDGYTSMRCMANLDGCDDLACVCTCHIDEPTTDEPPALPEQTAGPHDVPPPPMPDEAYPADAVELPTAGDPARRVIVNELGNEIAIAVTRDDRGVTVSAVGPTSQVEHTWTPAEADTIRTLLDKPDDEPAARRWWHRIPWRTR